MEGDLREVHFDKYCKTCEHWTKKECEDPCNDCLSIPANVDTHEPVFYKEKKSK